MKIIVQWIVDYIMKTSWRLQLHLTEFTSHLVPTLIRGRMNQMVNENRNYQGFMFFPWLSLSVCSDGKTVILNAFFFSQNIKKIHAQLEKVYWNWYGLKVWNVKMFKYVLIDHFRLHFQTFIYLPCKQDTFSSPWLVGNLYILLAYL